MDRIALVIGNADYVYVNKLNNPTNDANDIASILEKLGFKVIKLLNGTLNEIQAAVNTFLSELDEYATGLFYYAGHGMQIDGENYIVPIDCVFADKGKTVVSCYGMNEYLKKISVYKGKTNICILDACRDNPFANGRELYAGFSEFKNQPKGTIIAYSTSPDCTASDGTGSNGLYTQVLKDNMQIPNLKIEEMFKSVRIKVLELSNDTQISWEHSSLIGDFYFAVSSVPVNQQYSDNDIFSFINSRRDYYEKSTEDIYDIECMPYIDAFHYFKIPIIRLLRAFSRIQYKREGKSFCDATIDELNFSYLKSWGFHQKCGRWYYKDNYAEMGDPLPLPSELSPLPPLEGKELKIGGRIKYENNNGKIRFTLFSNVPTKTPLMFNVRSKSYQASSNVIAENHTATSEWFSNHSNALKNGHYQLEITCPTYNIIPNEIKDIFGERNRNLVGESIRFDPIIGNTICMKFEFLIKGEDVIVFN